MAILSLEDGEARILGWTNFEPVRTARTSNGSVVVLDPLANLFSWGVTGAGAVLKTAWADLYAQEILLTVFDTIGSTPINRLGFRGEPIPDGSWNDVIARHASALQPNPEMQSLFEREVYRPPIYPPLDGLVLSSDGTSWFGFRPSGGVRSHWILDPEGEVVAMVVVPESNRLLAASAEHAWAAERDELGVESLVRYRIVRSVSAGDE